MKQRLNLITLGVDDMNASTAFFEGLGWTRSSASMDELSLFHLGGIVLALHPRKALAEDAKLSPDSSGFSGITLAYNTESEKEVDEVLNAAAQLGATIIKPAEKAHWGGYSGYFRDLNGHVFEVAYNPFWPLDENQIIQLPE